MNSERLQAHSIAEVYLYVMATACESCHGGRLECIPRDPAREGAAVCLEVDAVCQACSHQHQFTFTLPAEAAAGDRDDLYPIINPGDGPSQVIDVGQWITLFRVILEAAEKEKDKIESRRLGFEAAQCLEEAIKFYDPENELPPEDAVFCEATRKRLREHPQQFARRRLMDMRAKLPASVTMQRRIARDARAKTRPKRPWWKLWK